MKRNLTERTKAKLQVATGTVQEAVGRATGNETMEAKGAARKVVGHARDDAALADEKVQNAKENVKGRVEEAKGAARAKAGEILDDKTMQVKGKLEEIKGEARQALNP